MSSESKVVMYTDGACRGNPGPGGYGAILSYRGHHKEFHGGYRKTTNNRMEIYAAIVGLAALKRPCKVVLHTDSMYLVNAIKKGWAKNWRARGWWRNAKEPAKNIDLWDQLLKLCDFHEVDFKWVKGHSGNKGNDRADELAVKGSHAKNNPVDEGFENPVQAKGARAEAEQVSLY